MPITHNTFTLERTYAASPARLFGAFSDPARKRRWIAEGGSHHVLEDYELDFRVRGWERVQSRFLDSSPFPGVEMLNEGVHLEIAEGSRIVIASSMAVGGRRISVSLVTFEIASDGGSGSKLVLTHQAAFFEGADGPQIREAGWDELLKRLAANAA